GHGEGVAGLALALFAAAALVEVAVLVELTAGHRPLDGLARAAPVGEEGRAGEGLDLVLVVHVLAAPEQGAQGRARPEEARVRLRSPRHCAPPSPRRSGRSRRGRSAGPSPRCTGRTRPVTPARTSGG